MNPFAWKLRQFDMLLRDVRAIRNRLFLGPPLPTPSSGDEAESSPPPKTWAELMDLGIKVQRLEDRLAALEPGPPSPASSRQRVTCPYCLTVFEQVSILVGPNPSGPPSPPSSNARAMEEPTP